MFEFGLDWVDRSADESVVWKEGSREKDPINDGSDLLEGLQKGTSDAPSSPNVLGDSDLFGYGARGLLVGRFACLASSAWCHRDDDGSLAPTLHKVVEVGLSCDFVKSLGLDC